MNKQAPLTWKTIRVRLGDLQEWDKNPVQISERDARELARSLAKFDHVLPYVAAAPPNGHKSLPLLDGHQRKAVEIALNKISPDTKVDVRVPSRKLTERERQEIAVRLRKNTGEFDFDKLANFFEVPDLLEWGFSEKELQLGGFADLFPNDFDMSGLPQNDRAPFRQMTFTLHDTQAEQVFDALKAAKALGPFVDSPNENSNGNALARICETFITEHGNG